MKKMIVLLLAASLLLSACGDGNRTYRIVFTDGTEKMVSHFLCVSNSTRVDCYATRSNIVPNVAYYDIREFEEIK